MRLLSFGGYGLALTALALVLFGTYDSYPLLSLGNAHEWLAASCCAGYDVIVDHNKRLKFRSERRWNDTHLIELVLIVFYGAAINNVVALRNLFHLCSKSFAANKQRVMWLLGPKQFMFYLFW